MPERVHRHIPERGTLTPILRGWLKMLPHGLSNLRDERGLFFITATAVLIVRKPYMRGVRPWMLYGLRVCWRKYKRISSPATVRTFSITRDLRSLKSYP